MRKIRRCTQVVGLVPDGQMEYSDVHEHGTSKCQTELNKRSHHWIKCTKDSGHDLVLVFNPVLLMIASISCSEILRSRALDGGGLRTPLQLQLNAHRASGRCLVG